MTARTAVRSEFLLGLVGLGVTPSLTPPMHMEEGRAQGLSIVSRPIDLAALGLDAHALPEILDWAERLGFDALNVTHPCKRSVIPLLDRLDPVAADLGAVNTVLFTPEGRVGYNTDTSGFERAFREGLPGVGMRGIVQFGAGGAGAAVADALLRLGASDLVIVETEEARASELAADLATRHGRAVHAAGLDRVAGIFGAEGVRAPAGVVNCTPIGMAHHPGTPFDPALLRSEQWVADIVYRPLDTELLLSARETGCRTLHGGRMAVGQAADTFRLVTGRDPDPERMHQYFRSLINAEEAVPTPMTKESP